MEPLATSIRHACRRGSRVVGTGAEPDQRWPGMGAGQQLHGAEGGAQRQVLRHVRDRGLDRSDVAGRPGGGAVTHDGRELRGVRRRGSAVWVRGGGARDQDEHVGSGREPDGAEMGRPGARLRRPAGPGCARWRARTGPTVRPPGRGRSSGHVGRCAASVELRCGRLGGSWCRWLLERRSWRHLSTAWSGSGAPTLRAAHRGRVAPGLDSDGADPGRGATYLTARPSRRTATGPGGSRRR